MIMARRHIRLIFLMLVMTTTAFTQNKLELGFEIWGQFSMSRAETISLDDAQDFLSHKIRYLNDRYSPSPGMLIMYSYDPFYLKSGLQYRTRLRSFDYKDYTNLPPVKQNFEDQKTHQLLIPFELGITIQNISLGMGVSMLYSHHQIPLFSDLLPFEDRSHNIDCQGQFTAAIRFQNFRVSAQYAHAFSYIGQQFYYRQTPVEFRQKAHTLGLGISWFFPN